MSRVAQSDWSALVRASEEVVETDTHGFPTVTRDLQGLYQSAQAARIRTSKLRSQQEQAAATRLLAIQGFDASRLQQDVSMLELQPTVQDVFSADTTNVEDYLQQIQDMTIITAIQEAQQDALLSFERVMQQVLARDWAADKGRLFGMLAPASGTMDLGASGPLSNLQLGSLTNLPPPGTVFMGSSKDSALEQSYVQAAKQVMQATAAGKPVDVIGAFAAACTAHEDKAHDALMSSCWRLLKDVTSSSGAAKGPELPALLEGARGHLQQLFAHHMRTTINHNRSTALRGGDPDQLKDVQGYIAVKFRDAGPLDFQGLVGSNSLDTSWAQLFFALRAGWHDTALRAAAACQDLSLTRAFPQAGLVQALQQFLSDRVGFRREMGGFIQQHCDRLLAAQRQQAATPLKAEYQLLVYAMLGGHNKALETLFKAHPHLLPTLEDYVWAKLMVVDSGSADANGRGEQQQQQPPRGSVGSSNQYVAEVYGLYELQRDLNRWPPSYYSKEGREPLLYLTLLLNSLQFRAGLRYLWRDDAAAGYRVDAVHLALALHLKGLLGAKTEASSDVLSNEDIGNMLVEFGNRYISRDPETALYYFMLATEVAGSGLEAKARLFKELLIRSKGFGTLLGAGGQLGSGGALQVFAPTPEERQELFGAVACEFESQGQLPEAEWLHRAAGRPLAALGLINQQISQELLLNGGAMTSNLTSLLSRAAAAEEALRAQQVEGAARVVETQQQLVVLQRVLAAKAQGKWLEVLKEAEKLQFVPSEQARVHVCIQAVRQLQDPVANLMGELILAMTTAARGLRASGAEAQLGGVLPGRVRCLKDWVLDLNQAAAQLRPEVYQALNDCVREFSV